MILEYIPGVKSTNGSAVRSLREKVLFFRPVAAGRKPDFETAELLQQPVKNPEGFALG